MLDHVRHHTARFVYGILILAVVFTAPCYARLTDEDVQAMLGQPYELNADMLVARLKQGRFDDVEIFIDYVLKNKVLTRDGFRYFRAILERWFFASEVLEFDRPFPVPQDILPYIETWIEEKPDSDIAYIVRGVFNIERAWEIRKRGWGSLVSKDQKKIFRELHLLAKGDLEKAYAIDPSNPHSSRQLIRVQRALDSKDKDATERYFIQATKDNPTFYWAYRAKLENMTPKWGGNWKEMFAFAADTAKNAPPKTLLPHIYAYAIEEAAARSQDQQRFLNEDRVWNALESIYSRIFIDFPTSSYWRIKYAKLALSAGKMSLAEHYLEEAEKIGPNDFRVFEYKAFLAEKNRQWRMEELYARRLIQSCPLYTWAYAMLGYALDNQQCFPEAIENYSTAIELNPHLSSLWGNRCSSHNKINDYQKAVNDCSKAIELDSKYLFGYQQREYAYKKLGNIKAAEADRRAYERLFK